MKYLTSEQVTQFDKDGYLVIKGFFNKNEISELEQKILDFAKKRPEDWTKGKEMAYYETIKNNERVLARIEKYVDYHEDFRKIAYSEKIMACMEDLMGEPCLLFKDKINFKRPSGGGFKPHQDMQARWDDFASYFMNVMITTDDSSIENGCLEVAPNHHKRRLIGKYDAPLQGKDLEGMNFIPCPTLKGDVIFFDCFTPHRSKPNLSNKPRSNIYLTYNRVSEGDHRLEYLARKRKELPPDNERTESIDFKDSPLHEIKYKDTRRN